MAADSCAKGAFSKLSFSACDSIQHRHHRAHACSIRITHGNGFGCAREAGVSGIDIEIEDRCRITRDNLAGLPVDIVHPVYKSGDVVKVSNGAFSILASLEIHDCWRGTACSRVNASPADFHIMRRVDAM